jgi:hypothetical protein
MTNTKSYTSDANDESFHVAEVSLRAIFKKVPSQYPSVTGLYIGKVKVASYCMDGISSKTDPKKYAVNSSLPTIKDHLGRFETEEECKEVCIRVAKVFCQQLEG